MDTSKQTRFMSSLDVIPAHLKCLCGYYSIGQCFFDKCREAFEIQARDCDELIVLRKNRVVRHWTRETGSVYKYLADCITPEAAEAAFRLFTRTDRTLGLSDR